MRILIDIGHPAHVHFFRNPIKLLSERGHKILILSREKECTLDLLNEYSLDHISISSQGGNGIISLARELVIRNLRLGKIAREFHPHIMAAIGGVSIAQVGRFLGIPSVVFYDTENAHLQNAITYPFAHLVVVPRCYSSWVPRRRHTKYNGYHELSYLDPRYFEPNRLIAVANGVSEKLDTFFIRVVSWQASHDVGEQGWSLSLLEKLTYKLEQIGVVIISSEMDLPESLDRFKYKGRLSEVHHVLAYCRAYIGESATMASECAVLGIPAIYAATTGRGYTDEQEKLYKMVRNVRLLDWSILEREVDQLLAYDSKHWLRARQSMLSHTTDVTKYVVKVLEDYPYVGDQAESLSEIEKHS
ncbi:MAG: DUF354 domain-containing protein [Gammaproteobacteria bacterium]|nr:DUF354 domain-containing protein [Gammaproteobacteria bacterium]